MEWIFLFFLSLWGLRQDRDKESEPVEEDESPKPGWARSEIPFDPGDPTTWDEYEGQENVKEIMQLILAAYSENSHPKLLLEAPAGTGKTALARIFARYYLEHKHKLTNQEYAGQYGRYIEITPAMVKTKADLDRLMADLRLWDVLLIDEVHMFNRDIADTLLPALEDNLYPFPNGMAKLPPAMAWIAATTDVGLLPEAFQNRFQLLTLEPLGIPELKQIVQRQPIRTSNQAAEAIATRAAGVPREVKRVYARARDVAVSRGSEVIYLEHALEAFRLLGLDTNGLYPVERRILEILYTRPKFYAPRKDGTVPRRYAQSERTLRTLTGLDENRYKQVETKLLRLGYITIGTGGRELTPKAIDEYFDGVPTS